MGATRDFVSATVADALLPTFRRPVEDIIYETLDRRQIPTRTDFKEMRDLVNNLRGQVSGTSSGIRKVVERSEEAEDILDQLETRLDALEARVASMGSGGGGVSEALEARLQKLEKDVVTRSQLAASVSAVQASFPAAVTPQQLEAALAALRKEMATAPQPAAVAPAPVPAAQRQCHVDGCDAPGRARGFCSRHYAQWRRGNLDDQFVTLEGTVRRGDQEVSVGEQYAASKYTIEDGKILISGAVVGSLNG